MVEIVGLHKVFGSQHVLQGIDLEVNAGEVMCVIGPSGSGKSTLLRCVNRLEIPDAGRVYVDGVLMGYREKRDRLYDLRPKEIAAQRRPIGMVFQRFNLFQNMTALENVMEAPIRVAGEAKDIVRDRAVSALERVGLGNHCDHYPLQLSGGQQQRVAIARALAMQPRLMLFDEPTSALDPELVGDVLDVMRELAQSGMTMMVVTHEIGFAREVGDRLVFMADGRVVESGDAREVLENPQNPRTARFLDAVLA
ncbi:amino acid ABC transporter ATP-binding protein [Microbacterium caowuchunii]|uniref:ABC-type polar-amino-acid transporter n=1 Tax=Microbacterium caowuchunii TaxID=2614638 RepID=A0A5N0TEW3_9MICO|nr:amino acid ABC transporter ATP-binding protein [Microbacterium caowuchunii]KAA9133605.1 amino acid ABC transporter ATP-binding protein [Microbacterium caowuchunii]